MRRYRDSILKIDSFRLCGNIDRPSDSICYHNLIADAMKMGATDLQLALPHSFTLREEVLGSETLLRLSVRCCEIDGEYLSFSRLKSLSLESVVIRDSTISCCNSLEELSLTKCRGLEGKEVNLNKLCKLRSLCLNSMYVDRMFFTEFASRFPCLKDFALSSYYSRHKIGIASTSLQTITFKDHSYVPYANFNVPNIKKFTCSSSWIPNLSVQAASREWEFDISVSLNGLRSLTVLRPVEENDVPFDTRCKRLMHQVITPNCGIPDQDTFGQFGLKKVCMEKDYEKYEDGGIHGTKTRFELTWL